jgi:hypothetical protein
MTGPDEIRAAMGWPAKHPALTVRCPRCKADEGQRCTGLVDKRAHDEPHLARITAAEQPTATVLPFQPRST